MIVGEYDMAEVGWFEQNRNPNTIFADLHEHLRRNRVLHICLNAETDKAMLPRRRVNLDWVRPIYDMESIAKRLNDDAIYYGMRNKGIDLNAAGTLVPDRVAFMWSVLVEPDVGEDWRWMECITAIDPVSVSLRLRPERGAQEGFLAHLFEREQWTKSRNVVQYGHTVGKPTGWICRRAFYNTNGWSIENQEDYFSAIDQINLPEADRESYLMQNGFLLALCGTIASEPQLAEPTPSDRFASMNRGRHMGKLPLVPPVRRVLDIARKVYQSNGPGAQTGREMPKHFRRGTFRTFRHERFINVRGQQRPVKSTIVRSDREGEIAIPLYNVVDGQSDT